jgi:hypothetical protein
MRWLTFSSALLGLMVIGLGCTYVPHFAWCDYWDSPVGTKIGRHFTFSPPSKERALHELKDALPHLDITDHWKEKVAVTECEPMRLFQRDQCIQSVFAGLAFISFPFIYRSLKRKTPKS